MACKATERGMVDRRGEPSTPCSKCQYGGKHLDAPPCNTCPAYPKGGEIDNEPTVDAVPVVRCKDCKYHSGRIPGQPNIICFQMHDDDFCSYGEPKDDTNE